MANWRPVSLLTTDYKILTKALAMRLQKIIGKLINSDQVGYIKNRYIGENIRIIFDIMKYAEEEELEAYLAQIDFEKAFDSIEWPFLLKVLEHYNFGDNFRRWIKILYTDIQSCVGNNGHYSQFFKLSRSIRQGCPISALLFLLVAEIIAIDIREDREINGININGTEFKISLMADDTTLSLINLKSLEKAITRFKAFQHYSGLKLNLNKTELIPIGKLRNTKIILPKDIREIKVKHGPFKALGIWYSNVEEEIQELNLKERVKKMETIINMWTPRNLSLRGKVTIIKTLILPQIQFLFSSIAIPDALLHSIDKLLIDYLWDGKTAKVKRTTVIGSIEDGGLNMVDVFVTHTAAKASWIKRLNSGNSGKWKVTTNWMLNLNEKLLFCNPDKTIITNGKTLFHQQIIKAWQETNSTNPKDSITILSQRLIMNQHIKISDKMINFDLFDNMENIKTTIKDIMTVNGKFKTRENVNRLLNENIDDMKFNSIKTAIPTEWKKIISNCTPICNNIDGPPQNIPSIIINGKYKLWSKITSKDIYRKIIKEKIVEPTSAEAWEKRFLFIPNWKENL